MQIFLNIEKTKLTQNHMQPFKDHHIYELYTAPPAPFNQIMLQIRTWIFQAPKRNSLIGPIKETLRWGEASYINEQGHGSLLRIAYKDTSKPYVGLYFHCKTTLIGSIAKKYGNAFTYQGNRAIIFDGQQALNESAIKDCIEQAMLYHHYKKTPQ